MGRPTTRISADELQIICRAWEMNNGVHGWEEFNELLSYMDSRQAYEEWVEEKSLHKSYLNYGWSLIEWLLKKSEA